ncbi:MAG: Gfo/Idh/MocA family oxidoreductase [Candidatus Loosdrechtia sp.]|uniref:Gfo/Idh/MocA family oxidoreductase n=1 Tax=Candidatus Loosdrechtia sp. TaxID=3101272 RepID=UPI003A71DB54|nr:MAG: Gfo/Idh/MocA family oxidoreductase [Candidatus Jettenia sp. AMX2]
MINKTNNSPFIALAGLGYWGKNLLRNFYELGVLHTACDADPVALSGQQKKYPEANYCNSFDVLLSHPEVQAVAISTPAATHYELIKKALKAGKDVFVEKPLALTVREGEELVKLSERENRILMVGHILQYHPAVVKLKELIATGQLGKVQYIYSNRLNIGKLRTEENILWSFAPHDISVILMLLEDEPVKISAYGGDYLNKGIYDTTLTALEFKSEVKGHIFVSWIHPYKEQKLIVVGSGAMAVFDDVSKEKLYLYPHTIEWRDGKIPVAQKADYQVVPVESGEPLKRELSHFIECVIQRKKPQTDGYEGLRVLKILELAEKSIASSKQGTSTTRLFDSPTPQLPNSYVHESAYIDEDVVIGDGTKVWYFSHILKGSKIGKNCIIGQNVTIGPEVEIGDRCKIQNNVSVYEGVKLEDEVFCGPSCVFTNVYNPRAFIERKHEYKQTLVKRGATIGANATIVCGITIGEYAMVGAGAVVKRDVPDHAIVAGVPAKQTGWACKCGTTLRFSSNHGICGYCGNTYVSKENKLITNGCGHE